MKKLLLILLILCSNFTYPYEFKGIHYTASYKQCESGPLNDACFLHVAFINAVLNCGATILAHHMEKFEPNGMTAFCVLSESHASIHTYPEHDSVFVDLFTCGDSCDWEEFEKVMVQYLKPGLVERKVLVRE